MTAKKRGAKTRKHTDQEYLQLLQLLHSEGKKRSTESIQKTLHEFGFNNQIGTVLTRAKLIKYPEGPFKGWEWNTIAPNMDMVKRLLAEQRRYWKQNAAIAKTKRDVRKIREERRAKKEVKNAESQKATPRVAPRNLRPANKLNMNQDFRIGMLVGTVFGNLDVIPSAQEIHDALKEAQELKKRVYK